MRNTIIMLGVVGALAGCGRHLIDSPVSTSVETAVEPEFGIAGYSVQGRAIPFEVWGRARTTVMITASIHGDEPAGTPLLERLSAELAARPDLLHGRRVVLVPVVNPDGIADSHRYNANGVDLNRNFPAENWRRSVSHGRSPLSEPESRALHELIERVRPAHIVSIHQPLACIDYDGPAASLAGAMGEVSDLPIRRLGARAGSLGSFTGVQRDIPTITLELPGNATRQDAAELWNQYGPMLLAAIRFDGTDELRARRGVGDVQGAE